MSVEKTQPPKSAQKSQGKRTRRGLAARRSHPIADKLVKKMKKTACEPVMDLRAVIASRERAEALQKTVATREALANYHPAHAIYVYAQNQASVMVEQLAELKEMEGFDRVISRVAQDYLPSGPPMSPLTKSFFTCWAYFDVCMGIAQETPGTTTLAVGAAFGMSKELLSVLGLMQASRMGLYEQEGAHDGRVTLRELVTGNVCTALSPAGYLGQKGELWYARVLPPPVADFDEHVVFTTPYVIVEPSRGDWLSYFDRTLPAAPLPERIAAYQRHMKFGPTRDYWPEYVFEAYANHQHDVIFLKGLPDRPETRPHSRANS